MVCNGFVAKNKQHGRLICSSPRVGYSYFFDASDESRTFGRPIGCLSTHKRPKGVLNQASWGCGAPWLPPWGHTGHHEALWSSWYTQGPQGPWAAPRKSKNKGGGHGAPDFFARAPPARRNPGPHGLPMGPKAPGGYFLEFQGAALGPRGPGELLEAGNPICAPILFFPEISINLYLLETDMYNLS